MYRRSSHLKLATCVLLAAPVLAAGGTLPPDPTNAALLYYQAFLLLPEPNEVEGIKGVRYNLSCYMNEK